MGLLRKKKQKTNVQSAVSVQTSPNVTHPYYQLNSHYPLNGNSRICIAMREAVPIIDAAVNKIVRLAEGFKFETGDEKLDYEINEYFNTINVGGTQLGISAFVSNYLNQLLTVGTAVGEIVLGNDGIYALYNSDLGDVELRRSSNGIDVDFYAYGKKISNPNLILYSVINPQPNKICGTSLLQGLPFITDILMKIYNTIGENWEHAGNLRYAVVCKPTGDMDSTDAQERAAEIATAWRDAMNSENVKDFVAVGDVSIKVIGADNICLDSQVPVKQLMEQIVAKMGLPPFMLGLNWSTTERMSKQQADILTSELESYRRILTPMIKKIGDVIYKYISPLNTIRFDKEGCDFDYWDNSPYLFKDFDNLNMTFNLLSTI